MGALDPPPLPPLKSFTLTHILYDPTHPLSIPLTLLSLSPIFLFVSYTTLLIFTRRLTIFLLLIGQLGNEVFNLVLKRIWRAERPYLGQGEIGDGYGMPSSHSQFSGFLVIWGIGFVMTLGRRYRVEKQVSDSLRSIRRWRVRIYVFGLCLWSISVAYSRYHLRYHSPYQILAGYLIGLVTGSIYFVMTEYLPLYHPQSVPARIRSGVQWYWESIGGIGGYDLGGAEGGWGEGKLLLEEKKR